MDYTELSDNELYTLFGQGHDAAFDVLYGRYWKRLLYKAMLKLEAEEDAEELTQDTLLDIWKSKGRLQIRNSFSTYIGAILRYKILERMAARRKEVYQAMDDLSRVDTADHTTQQWLDFADLRDELEAAIESLPEKCRLVFRMSREKGLSDRQIAEELDVSQKTVEAHISRALKSLRVAFTRFPILFSLFFILLIYRYL